MKVINIEKTKSLKLVNGTLPDIDTDFAGRDRAGIKSFMETQFGKQQVCSVGTFTTFRPRGAVKDLARNVGIDFSESNLITSIIDKDDLTLKDVFLRAMQEPRLKEFIKRNSDIFHILPTILNQPKTKSIHACAVIVFPDVMSSSEWCPTRLQQGLMVTEWGGGEMDNAGFLKDDILGIKQLDKFSDILNLIKKNGKEVPDIYNLPHDNEVYRYFGNGWNGDVFQLGSSGLTEYSKSLKPQTMDDLIAEVALYRPGTMENHYHEIYVKCKNEGRQPTFLWGTENITKNTFGLIIYQEQVMKVFSEIGGLTNKESDDVRRSMGHKDLSALLIWKEKVNKGFLEKGATQAQFEEVWNALQEFAKYGFNRSHATAYAMTAYVCQWLKVHYPIEYWTVSLSYADEAKSLTFLSEILATKKIKIKSSDINQSKIAMSSNQIDSTIFWGIESIKGIGEETANQIIEEREKNGEYKSFANFLFRHLFKGSKVKKQTYEALISSGAFDSLYGFENKEENRLSLINRFRKFRKVKVSNPKRDIYTIGTLTKKWWWLLQQKALTGLAFFDYEKLLKDNDLNVPFTTPAECRNNQMKGLFRSFGGYVLTYDVRKGARGKYAKIKIEHNYKIYQIMIWNDEYEDFKEILKNCEKSLILFSGNIKYESKYVRGNQFTLCEDSKIIILK